MDNYHVPHGKGSSFSSWARLSILWIWSSSPDGDIGGDAFFRYTFRVGRVTSISFSPNSKKNLRWIFRFAFRWLYTLISSRVWRFSTNSMREYDFSSSFTDSFQLKLLICQHCSSFGLKSNLSFWPLMLSWITPTPTSMCAVVILKNGLPNMRGIWISTSMSRMTKSTGTKKFRIFTGISSAIPAGWWIDWSASYKHMVVGASAWWLSLS